MVVLKQEVILKYTFEECKSKLIETNHFQMFSNGYKLRNYQTTRDGVIVEYYRSEHDFS